MDETRNVTPGTSTDAGPVDACSVAEAPRDVVEPAQQKRLHDLDARWGYKTAKNGEKERFFGYDENTIVQVPEGASSADDEPRLIVRIELTPAGTDVVEASLSLLDRLRRPARELIGDRHYHYKKTERWRDELADRGIEAVLDLRVDEHGFTELHHTRWAAGWPHCPATPDALGTIERPPPNADRHKFGAFKKRIALRQSHAFRRVTSPDPRGVARWECPAVAGTVGCPLRPGTVKAAVEFGLPVIDNPPEPVSPDFPACCGQRTVTLDPGPLRKLMQAHYWGTSVWEREWNKRTYVEGSYGNRKNNSTENLRRGHFRITGLALVNIAVAMSAVSYNLRILRNWHERTELGDADHPLLQPADDNHGYVRLTEHEHEHEQICDEERCDDIPAA